MIGVFENTMFHICSGRNKEIWLNDPCFVCLVVKMRDNHNGRFVLVLMMDPTLN